MKIRLHRTAALLAVSLLVLCAAYRADAAPTVTPGGLLQFTDQSEFQQAFPGLPKEDFEESPVLPVNYIWCTAPINSSTNNSCFLPGDILPGLAIDSFLPPATPAQALHVAGNGFNTVVVSDVVGAGNETDGLEISFPGTDVYAAGISLSVYTNTPGTIKIYGPSNTLLDTINQALTTTPTFFGIYSSQPITRIAIESTDWELVDNIQFGAISQDVTFYTSNAAFMAAHPGLPVEDFEESPVPSGGLVQFPQPLNSTTNVPAAFSPGDIVEGLTIQTVSTTNPATALTVVGDHYDGSMANASKMVCSTRLGDNLMTLFSGFNAYAVGMDLMPVIPSGTANQTAFIAVYGRGGRILGTTTISLASTLETFLGLDSKHLILGASVTIFNTPRYECIDNIQFGGFPKDLIFYQTETAFRNATGTLLLEDFSQGQVPDNMDNVCNEPIDSSTNQPGCFWAGDILPGISFQTENSLDPACPACMYVLGRNWGGYGNTTPMIYASTPDPDMLEVSFSGRRVNFVGMKLGVIAVIFVYGTDGTLLGSAVNNFPPVSPLDFWGVASRKPIGRITIYGAILDDIMFGARFPWPMFLPAINSTK